MDSPQAHQQKEVTPRKSMALKDKLRNVLSTARPPRSSFCLNMPKDIAPMQKLTEVIVPIAPGVMTADHHGGSLRMAAPLMRSGSSEHKRRSRHSNQSAGRASMARSSVVQVTMAKSVVSRSSVRKSHAARLSSERHHHAESRRRSTMRPVRTSWDTCGARLQAGLHEGSDRRSSTDSEAWEDPNRGSLADEHAKHACINLKAAHTEHAILHHRDSVVQSRKTATWIAEKAQHFPASKSASRSSRAQSIADLQQHRRRKKQERTSSAPAAEAAAEAAKPERQQPMADPTVRALRRLRVLEGCSDRFFEILASGSERLHLGAGSTRQVSSSRISGAQRQPAVAVMVERGTLRVEAGAIVIDEIGPGATFGLANVMASLSGNAGREGLGVAAEFLLRCHNQSDGCHCVLFTNVAFRQALTQCPEDKARLRGLLHMVNCSDDSTQRILAALQCGEAMSSVIARSTTRCVCIPGDVVTQEGRRNPDGMVVIRSGTVQLEIGGVETRRVSDGQVMGEEMIFSVCQKWATTARCVTPCDIQILHRRLFVSLVREMRNGNSEEELESHRLLVLLEGHWKDDRAVLSWPLFRGYETNFISALAQLMETRVVLPGAKVWESGTGGRDRREFALYFILHGSCEEEMSSDRISRKAEESVSADQQGADGRPIKRVLAPGTCMGEREFLGLQEASNVVVKARRLCLLAVLHRSVFLHTVDNHPSELQSPEVTRLLEQELDHIEPPLVSGLHEKIIRGLPLFRGCDRRFVERLCDKVDSSYFIGGQLICRSGVEAKAMLIVARGEVIMTMAKLEIRRYVRGKALNILALSSENFLPAYALTCERACEVWTLERKEFANAVDSFPLERRRLCVLVGSEALNTLHPEEECHGYPSPSAAVNPNKASNFDWSEMALFRGCCQGMLQYLRSHLETTVCFPDEVIYREGSEDESLYIICSGMVIVQGSKDNSQASLSKGDAFGEHRLLEVEERARATVTAVEITVLQVLHRCVLLKGLEQFPGDAQHFDSVAVSWLNASGGQDLARVPFFTSCGSDFLAQVRKFLNLRLIHKGGLINEEGPNGRNLCILRSGSAVEEQRAIGLFQDMSHLHRTSGLRRFRENSVVNADVVLGLTRRPPPAIRAERICIVAEIPATDVLNVLQRFPEEVSRLVESATGALWPPEISSVPFFRGVGSAFFERLMEVSEWVMYLPEQTVVKQNGTGDVLYLLCYGTAVTKIDGMVVGHALSPGDTIGTANLLRVSDRYRTCVRSQSVCHFRTLTAGQVDQILPEHIAERERIEGMRQQVQQKLGKEEQTLRLQASREKLKQRADGAFRRHIKVVRGVRGASKGQTRAAPVAAASDGSEESSGDTSDSTSTTTSDSSEEAEGEAFGKPKGTSFQSNKESMTWNSEDSSQPSRKARPALRQVAPPQWAPVQRARSKALAAALRGGRPQRGRWLLRRPQNPRGGGKGAAGGTRTADLGSSASNGDSEESESGSCSGSGSGSSSGSSALTGERNSSSSFGTSQQGISLQGGKDPPGDLDGGLQSLIAPTQRIGAAILDYAGAKKHALLRARVLRLYHSGMPLDGTTRSTPRLDGTEIEQLDGMLPSLRPGDPQAGAKAAKIPSDDRDRDRLLQERFRELSAAPFRRACKSQV